MARRPKVTREQWKRQDWKRPAPEIALALGVSLGTVYRWAARIGETPVKVRGGTDWPGMDWNKTTAQIKEETGVSRQRISKMRKTYAPETVKRLV